jgi:hypothetical protein
MRYTIDAPPQTQDAVGGLLGVANIVPQDDLVTFHGVNYLSILSGHSRRYEEGVEKVFDELPVVEGDPVTIYRGIDTSLLVQGGVGAPEVERAFNASASYGVEEYVQEILNSMAVDITPTPGTPVTNIKAAVGLLEQYAAQQYSGLPLLHANKFAVELMTELSVGEGNKLHTVNGTPIANGGGYGPDGPGALTADANEAWVYISGQVNIWQGDVEVLEGPNLKANRNLHLAEASYTAAIESFAAAILIGYV